MKLELKKSSWKNLLENIRSNPYVETKGNFWAAIQSLEEQIEQIEEENNGK